MDDLYTDKPSQIVVYAASWCSDCKRARAIFDEYQVPHLLVDIDQDVRAAEYISRINNGMRSVPTILFPDGTKLVEPSSIELTNKLNS